MMFDRAGMLSEVKQSLEYLERSSAALTEEDSLFTPQTGMFTAAQQFAHIGHTVHWLLDGAFSPKGFDMDFEKHAKDISKVTSIAKGREIVRAAYAAAMEAIEHKSDSEWTAPIAPGPVMGGDPRFSALFGVIEHTAHHRGALSVYSRLAGKVPAMPYM